MHKLITIALVLVCCCVSVRATTFGTNPITGQLVIDDNIGTMTHYGIYSLTMIATDTNGDPMVTFEGSNNTVTVTCTLLFGTNSAAGETVVDTNGGFTHYSSNPQMAIFYDANTNAFVLITTSNSTVTIAGKTMSAGFATSSQQAAALNTITFPASTVAWTNTQGYNISMYINNTGVTGTACKKNGTTICTSAAAAITLTMKPGDYFSETYTAGTPVGNWEPQ